MGPTGTNLLGLVKHLAGVEGGYLGDTFGRPFPEPLPWTIARMPNDDMWAHPEESRDDIVALYRRVWQHSDVTWRQPNPTAGLSGTPEASPEGTPRPAWRPTLAPGPDISTAG